MRVWSREFGIILSSDVLSSEINAICGVKWIEKAVLESLMTRSQFNIALLQLYPIVGHFLHVWWKPPLAGQKVSKRDLVLAA